MATSTVPAVRSALITVLKARPNITGTVNVYEFYPGPSAVFANREWIWLGKISVEQSHLAFGGSREEELTVEGRIEVGGPSQGDAAFAQVEDRAYVLLAEIEAMLRSDPTVGAVTFHGEIGTAESELMVDELGPFAQLDFTLNITSHI